ncbi:hypothetical protein DFH06DRAFT_1322225 [Mycena polygramma]|nr:hypothetical protein DFH06DRAFT_1322225 [Mycena polygramma]
MSTIASPAALKQLEKHIEKHKAKAEKAAVKADQTIEKITKAESATLKALNKATHHHDAVIVDLHSAERDAEVKHHEDEKLTADLEAKKAYAAEVLQAQLAHAEERKSKILELRQTAGFATPESRLSDASG